MALAWVGVVASAHADIFIQEPEPFFPPAPGLGYEGTVLKTLRQDPTTPPAIPIPDASFTGYDPVAYRTTFAVRIRTGVNTASPGSGFTLKKLEINPAPNPATGDNPFYNDVYVTFYRDNGDGIWQDYTTDPPLNVDGEPTFRIDKNELNPAAASDTTYVSVESDPDLPRHLQENTDYWMEIVYQGGDATASLWGALTDLHYDAFGDWKRYAGYSRKDGTVVLGAQLQFNLYVEAGGTTASTKFDGTDTFFFQKLMAGAGAPEIAVEQPVGTDLVDGTASIDFGSVAVGSSSAAQTFTIKNTGTADLTGIAITKDGANPGDFTADTTGMSATVTAGSSTTFTVTFTPGATGARSAAIHVANNDGDENPFDIALTGTGTAAGPAANPDQIDRPTTARVVKVLQSALLANDTSPLPLTITAVANPLPAGATVVRSGSFVVYTAPAPNAGDGSFEYTASDGSATAVGTVTVKQVDPSGPNAQNAVKIEKSGSDVVITFIGVPGRNYQVQRAPAVTGPWTNVGGVQTAPASGVLTYTDISAPSPSFYRLILVP